MDPTFWQQHGHLIAAGITAVVAVAAAIAVDRLLIARATAMASRLGGIGDIAASRAAQTRLRLVRRLVVVAILVIGGALAMSQFADVERLATGILASSAVLGLIVGIAARQVLANPLAGILLAFTQPIRIGDTVTLGDVTGRVRDLTLSYTFIDPGDGRLMVVPNEQVVTSVLFNRSTGDRSAPARASVWIPPGSDLGQARAALLPLGATSVSVAEITADGVRLEVLGPRDAERTQTGEEESQLREQSHEALRDAGLYGG